jgi:hypothetical protein
MSKVAAWHSKRESDPKVYHDENTCTEGNNIETKNRVAGADGRPKCKRCKEISG